MSDSDRVPVGRCPDCGVVAEDAVDVRFPQPAKCRCCGAELSNCRYTDRAQLTETTGNVEITTHPT